MAKPSTRFAILMFGFSILLFVSSIVFFYNSKVNYSSRKEIVIPIDNNQERISVKEIPKQMDYINETCTKVETKVDTLVDSKLDSCSTSSTCSFNFLIITAPRNINSSRFQYLEMTIKSITDLKSFIFNPCIYIFNTHGPLEASELLQITKSMPNTKIFDRVKESNITGNIFSEFPKKKKQINDIYDMLLTYSELKLSDGPLIIMEDDFVFCPGAVGHLAYVASLVSQKERWSGIRFSYGLNGVIIQTQDIPAILQYIQLNKDRTYPVDWLLEELYNNSEFGKKYFKGRRFFTYRYQLMDHIGIVTSVGNVRDDDLNNYGFPKCYEIQTRSFLRFEFDIHACAKSLFSPCDKPSENDNVLNLLDLHMTASHDHAISHLHETKPILCGLGESCDECCKKEKSECDKAFFLYINNCVELRKHYPNCKCVREEVVTSSRAPNFDGHVCVLGIRRSRFNCLNKFPTERRLCPCKEV